MKTLTLLAVVTLSILTNSLHAQVPQILTQPAAQTVAVGSNCTFNVVAVGSGIEYQWLKGGVEISSATNGSYTITSAVSLDAGSYSVVLTNASGSVTSSAAALTVMVKPAITAQPASTNLAAGGTLDLSVTSDGDSLAYQWRKNGTNIPGATSSTLSIATAQVANSGTYTVVVSNAVGTATSSGAAVLVVAVPGIASQPANKTVVLGASHTFSVVVSNAASSLLSYQWMHSTNNLPNATNSTLSLTSITNSDAGNYTVVVDNLAGSTTSATAVLTVLAPAAITAQPASTNLASGQDIALSVTATGDSLVYQWRKGGTNISGATSAGLTISSAVAANSGTYSVVVSNVVSTVTSGNASVLVVDAPAIAVQPTNKSLTLGTNYTLAVVCSNASSSLLSYQWKHATTNLLNATNSTLSLTSVTANEAGAYAVVVTNLAGSITSSTATITVLAPVAITGHPASTNLASGGDILLAVSATGDALAYQWRKGGSNISGATSASLTLSSAVVANSGTYSVVVSNAISSVTSSNASVLVVDVPGIAIQPVSKGVGLGGSYTLSVTASNAATSLLSYQWTLAGTNLPGSTTNSYKITGATTNDGGSYAVIVSNLAGSVTSSVAVVTILTAPSITTQPTGTNLAVGGDLLLSVTGNGGLLGYQWRNGTNILVGSTSSSLTITNAQTTDSGNYTVVLSNAVSVVTSAAATVQVVAPPFITIQPKSKAVVTGADYNLYVLLRDQDSSLLNYQWTFGGVPIDGEMSSNLMLTALAPSSSGSYAVIITNIAGAVTSSVATLTVQSVPMIASQPLSTNIVTGGTLKLLVDATGDSLAYQWFSGTNAIVGATSASLIISNAQPSDSSIYSVRIANAVGNLTSANAAVYVVSAPVITQQPVGGDVIVGSDFIFNVSVNNAAKSLLTYQWMFNDQPIDGATAPSLFLAGVGPDTAGTYAVVITNIAGSVTSSVVTLIVETLPEFVTQPASTNLAVGGNIVLTNTATGGSLSYQWYKATATATNLLPGKTASSLVIANAQTTNSSSYFVTISNAMGKVTSSKAVVMVVAPPVIYAQPQSSNIVAWNDVSFTVGVSNAATSLIHYQWLFGGAPIDQATNSTLNLYQAYTDAAGSYSVAVTNIAGGVTSSIATLTVALPVTIQVPPASTNVGVGTNFTLSVTATGNLLQYQWSKDSVPLPGITTSNLTVVGAAVTNSGVYTVTITNIAGIRAVASAVVYVVAPPVIITQPLSKNLGEGDDYTFNVVVTNAATSLLSYQWYFQNSTTTNAIAHATNSALAMQNITMDLAGGYYVTITNLAGSNRSAVATLNVEQFPQITAQPISTNLAVGGDINLSVAGTGNLLAYQWYKDSAELTGSNANTLTITGAQTTDSGTYVVVITNDVGVVISSNVDVMVVASPVIGTQPASVAVAEGDDTTLTVAVNNAATSLLHYQWFFGASPITGATNSSLVLQYITTDRGGNYKVVITNLAGSVTSSVAALTVESFPQISLQPASTNLAVGGDISLAVTATGNLLKYQWYKDDAVLAGSNTTVLNITNAQTTNSGVYVVVITNDVGTVISSNVNVMVVAAPVIITNPVGLAVADGDSCIFNVVVTNAETSLLTYQWYFNATNSIDGATTNSLELGFVGPGDLGNYTVVVSNIAGVVTSTPAALLVQLMPAVTIQPISTNLASGGDITLTVGAVGDSIGFQWYLGNSILAGETSSNLTVSAATPVASGNYSVVITNAVGTVTSDPATVLVVGLPSIALDPVGAFIGEGSNYTFAVSVNNPGDLLSYQWRTNGQPLAGATSPTLTLSGVTTNNSGVYSVVITNLAGPVTSANATLTVEALPVITSQPASTNLAKGGDIVLRVAATGDMLAYQWRRGTRVVGGNTNVLTITNSQLSDSGSYSVVITNDVDAVTSSEADVLVVATPAITSAPVGAAVLVGTNYTFSIGIRNASSSLLAYQWVFNATNSSGVTNVVSVSATNSSLTLTSLTTNDSGYYAVIVTNLAGGITSSPVMLKVQNFPVITAQPATTNLAAGGSIVLGVTATGDYLGYQWRKGTNVLFGNTNLLTLTNAQVSDSGTYSVIVTNAVGSVTSSNAFIVVVSAPIILTQPLGRAVTNGGNHTFTVIVSNAANSLLSYQWTHASTNLPGATTNVLSMTGLTTNETGLYSVVITNLAGSVTSSVVTLNVQNRPLITVQPAPVNVGISDSFVLGVTATGEGIGYQWRKGGSNILNAKYSTYTNSSALVSDSGAYSVLVTNAVGSTISSNAAVLVVSAPVILTQPLNKAVTNGGNHTFTITMSNAASSLLSYQWTHAGTNLPGATTNTLSMTGLTTNESGLYSVIVTNLAGSVTSSVVTLKVQNMPVITVQPDAVIVGISNSFVLGVTATGEGIGYQWRKGSSNILNAKFSTYTNSMALVKDSGTYYVYITNAVGAVTSSNTSVLVLTPPVITAQPVSRSLITGSSATLSVTVSNAINLMATYQWTHEGTNIPGANTNILRLTTVSTNDSGDYTVVVTNVAGSVTSSVAAITVQSMPAITKQPASTNLAVGQDIALSVVNSGEGVGYQWRRGTTNIIGANSSALTITGAGTNNSGTYSVLLTNAVGSLLSSNAVVLVVAPPAIAVQPVARVVVAVGSNYTYSVTASNAATSLLNYQWSFNGTNIDGATTNKLKLTALDVTNTGSYSVLVSNLAGSVTSSVASLVVMAPPVILAQPSNTNIGKGQDLVLTVDAGGGLLQYQWRKGTVVIPGATTNTLTITNAQTTNSGIYSVLITNSVGKATSSNALVQVIAVPVIKTQPTNRVAAMGTNAVFTVLVTNVPSSFLGYQWMFNSTNVLPGATTNTLKLTGVTNSDIGAYTVVITNNLGGSVTSAVATLSVLTKPSITNQPASTNLAKAGDLVLSVGASGSSLAYKWTVGGKVVAGQTTSTLTITNAKTTNSGTYSVVVSNAVGSVTSSNVIVQVVAAPGILKQPIGGAVVAGTNFTFTMTASNAATSLLSYQWKHAGTNLPGANTNTLKLTNISTNDAGTYAVVITNLAGTVTSTNVTLLVQTKPGITTQPASTNLAVGGDIVLSATTTGSSVKYIWKQGTKVISGAITDTLTITNAKTANSGIYTLIVSNAVGKVTSSNTVVNVVAAPAFAKQPVGKALITGTNYTMSVTMSNAATSLLSYQWTHAGTNLTGATTNVLKLTGVTTNDAGTYTVVVTNVAGAVTSANAVLLVQDKPVITRQPASTNLAVGGDIVLNVQATGTSLDYKWRKGTNIVGNASTLTITNAQTTNWGVYSVVISNSVGKVTSSNVVVRVVAPPVLTSQPVGGAVAVGSNFTFSVVVTNATNSLLSYRWTLDGTPIDLGFTNVFKLIKAGPEDAGSYAVIVTNLAGAVTSSIAPLVVQAKPVITMQPPTKSIATNGSAFALTVGATGDSLFYQWRMKKGTSYTNVVNATNSVLSFASLRTNDAGTYSVVVSNRVGKVTSANSIVVVLRYNGSNWVEKAAAEKAVSEFAGAAGNYNGLFSAESGIALESAGFVTLTVRPDLTYSGKLSFNGNGVAISGQFDQDGQTKASFVLPESKTDGSIALTIDLAKGQLTGTVTSAQWTSTVVADRAQYAAGTAGYYQIVILSGAPGAPFTDATVSASESGDIIFVARTAEGSTITQTVPMSKDGYWPFFIRNGDTETLGWLQFINGTPAGTLSWIKADGSVDSSLIKSSAYAVPTAEQAK